MSKSKIQFSRKNLHGKGRGVCSRCHWGIDLKRCPQLLHLMFRNRNNHTSAEIKHNANTTAKLRISKKCFAGNSTKKFRSNISNKMTANPATMTRKDATPLRFRISELSHLGHLSNPVSVFGLHDRVTTGCSGPSVLFE